jgi:hypothetical protein
MERRVPEIATERDVILALADGSLPSPTTFCDRSGLTSDYTGIRYRAAHDEFVYRSRAWISPACSNVALACPLLLGTLKPGH